MDAPGRLAVDAPGRPVMDAPGRLAVDAPGRRVMDAPGRRAVDAPGRSVPDPPGRPAGAGRVVGEGSGRRRRVYTEAGWRVLAGRLAWVWGTAAVGTGTALGLDAWLGGVDGRPPLHLLVWFALPFWDGLPAGLLGRLAVLGFGTAAVAGIWLGLATVRPEPWWRTAVAFGLACALVGTVHALAARRRTVDP